jgi:two-component system alkaline phosphatase synthesis response regulator PhoP
VTPAPSPTRVLLVEDDRVVVETLTMYLEHAGYAVTATASGPEGLRLAQGPDVGLVILDWMVPGMSGPEVCRRLRAVSTVPILMLTARTAEDDRVRGLETGADDYVPKPFSPREVVARVQALLRRSPAPAGGDRATRPPTKVGELAIDHFRREVRVAGQAVPLTPTEFRLLEALAAHPGRAFTRDELVARAFGPDYGGLDRTIDTHVTNLRRKIDAGRDRRLIRTVHGVGYRLAKDDDR